MKGKRILKFNSILLSILLLFQFINIDLIKVNAAEQSVISYSVTGDTKIGSIYTINVNIKNATNLYGAAVDFAYDNTLLQIQDIAVGNIFEGQKYITPVKEITDKQISIGACLTGVKPGVTKATGTLFTIKVKALKAGTISLKTTDGNGLLAPTGNNMRVKLSDNNGNKQSYSSSLFTINQQQTQNCKITSFTTSTASGALVGTKIKLSATADIANSQFEFYAKESKDTSWTKLKGMGPASYAYWTPSKAGTYTLRVRAKGPSSTNKYDSYKDLTFTIKATTKTTVKTLTTSVPSGANIGTKIKVSATADLSGSLFEFYAKESKDTSWTKLKGMGPASYAYWTPSKPGTYTLRVRAKGPNSTNKYDSYKDITFTVKAPTATNTNITSFKTSVSSGAAVDTQIKLMATADLDNSQFEFYAKESKDTSWTKLKGMGPKNYAYWTPSKAGTYTLRVRAKGPDSTKKYDSYKDMTFKVTPKVTTTVKTLTTSVASGAKVGTKITVKSTADLADSQFEFYAKESKDSSWTKLKGMGPKNYAYWTPTKAGTYTIRVRAKGPNSTNKYDSYKDITFIVK